MKKAICTMVLLTFAFILNFTPVVAKTNDTYLTRNNTNAIAAAEQISEKDETMVITTVEDGNTSASSAGDGELGNNCKSFANTLRVVGYLILVVKIFIPLILIIKSSISLISVVTSGKSEEMSKIMKKFGISLLAGALVFLVPTVVSVSFNMISSISGRTTENADSKVCMDCLLDPFSDNCKEWADRPKECIYNPKATGCEKYR